MIQSKVKWLVAAMAMTGIAGGVLAQTSTDSASAPATSAPSAGTPGEHHWHHRGGPDMMVGGGMLRAFHQLNLTSQQQQQVKTILTSARQQMRSERQSEGGPDFTVLSNPGDPNYATAQQQLQTRMAARLQARSQIQQQLYDVLNKDQKAQLPTVLASMKARMGQHSSNPA